MEAAAAAPPAAPHRQAHLLPLPFTIEINAGEHLLRPAADLRMAPAGWPGSAPEEESFVAAFGRVRTQPAVVYTAAALSLPAGRLADMERNTIDVLVPSAPEQLGGADGTVVAAPDRFHGRAALSGYYHILETVDCLFGEDDRGDEAWRRSLTDRAVELFQLTEPITLRPSGMRMAEPLATASLATAAQERGVALEGAVLAGLEAAVDKGHLSEHMATVAQYAQYSLKQQGGGGGGGACPSPCASPVPPSNSEDALASLAVATNTLGLPEAGAVANLARDLVQSTMAQPTLCRRRQPSSIACAALYAASKLEGETLMCTVTADQEPQQLTQSGVCKLFAVTDMTMRSVLKQLLNAPFDSLLPEGYTPKVRKEEAFPQLGPWAPARGKAKRARASQVSGERGGANAAAAAKPPQPAPPKEEEQEDGGGIGGLLQWRGLADAGRDGNVVVQELQVQHGSPCPPVPPPPPPVCDEAAGGGGQQEEQEDEESARPVPKRLC